MFCVIYNFIYLFEISNIMTFFFLFFYFFCIVFFVVFNLVYSNFSFSQNLCICINIYINKIYFLFSFLFFFNIFFLLYNLFHSQDSYQYISTCLFSGKYVLTIFYIESIIIFLHLLFVHELTFVLFYFVIPFFNFKKNIFQICCFY